MRMAQQFRYLKPVLLLIAIVLGTLLVETGLRLRQWVKYGTAGLAASGHFTIDEQTGLRVPKAGASTQTISINSLGFRSPEIEQPKPPGRVRLAFIGASTTYCAEVSSNQRTWPYLVWKSLQDAYPTVALDYVNAAAPGYILSSSLRNLQHRVKPLAPDIIVLYEAQNDLAANSRELAKQQGVYEGWGDEKDWLSHVSLTWELIRKNVKLLRRQQKAKEGINRLAFEPQDLSKKFYTDYRDLVEASHQVASIVVMATFSYKIRREQTPEEQLKAASIAIYYMPYMSVPDLFKAYEEYNRVMRQVAQETGSILIDGEFTIPGDDKHFVDSFHFSDAGSAAMGRRIATGLLQSQEVQQFLQARSKS
jgi:lysophospholipase L1-like esterase